MSLADELLADLENPEEENFITEDTSLHMIIDHPQEAGTNLYTEYTL